MIFFCFYIQVKAVRYACQTCNIFLTRWQAGAEAAEHKLDYAAETTEKAGLELYKTLLSISGFDATKMTLVGHGWGAHVIGATGKEFSMTGRAVKRGIFCDATRMFKTAHEIRIQASHFEESVAIHTSLIGIMDAYAETDIYYTQGLDMASENAIIKTLVNILAHHVHSVNLFVRLAEGLLGISPIININGDPSLYIFVQLESQNVENSEAWTLETFKPEFRRYIHKTHGSYVVFGSTCPSGASGACIDFNTLNRALVLVPSKFVSASYDLVDKMNEISTLNINPIANKEAPPDGWKTVIDWFLLDALDDRAYHETPKQTTNAMPVSQTENSVNSLPFVYKPSKQNNHKFNLGWDWWSFQNFVGRYKSFYKNKNNDGVGPTIAITTIPRQHRRLEWDGECDFTSSAPDTTPQITTSTPQQQTTHAQSTQAKKLPSHVWN